MKKLFTSASILSIPLVALLNGEMTHSLSNEQIDRIFISFEQQAREEIEKEQAEEKKRKEEEKLLREQEKNQKNKSGYSSSRAVLSHDGEGVRVEGKSMGMPPPPPAKGLLVNEKIIQNFDVLGIICEHRECIALTTSGNLKKGDTLPTGEKIINITKTSIHTAKKAIDF